MAGPSRTPWPARKRSPVLTSSPVQGSTRRRLPSHKPAPFSAFSHSHTCPFPHSSPLFILVRGAAAGNPGVALITISHFPFPIHPSIHFLRLAALLHTVGLRIASGCCCTASLALLLLHFVRFLHVCTRSRSLVRRYSTSVLPPGLVDGCTLPASVPGGATSTPCTASPHRCLPLLIG